MSSINLSKNLILFMLLCVLWLCIAGISIEAAEPVTSQSVTSQSGASQLATLQAAWQQQPNNLNTALPLAQAYINQAQENDEVAYFAQAKAVLQPWWQQADVPVEVHLLRAQLNFQQHHLQDALNEVLSLPADKLAPLQLRESLLLQAQIQRMQGHYDQARALCIDLGRRASASLRALCVSSVLGLTGFPEQAYFLLNDMAYNGIAEGARRYQWVRTEMAMLNYRFGQDVKAWENFRLAVTQPVTNNYLWQGYGDFLLSRGEARKLLWELPEHSKNAGVQLRRLLAMQAVKQDFKALQAELQTQFAQARERDDRSFWLDEARFKLDVLGDAKGALALAQDTWKIRKAPELAEVYLRAALAGKAPQAAQQVLDWMRLNHWQDSALLDLQKKF